MRIIQAIPLDDSIWQEPQLGSVLQPNVAASATLGKGASDFPTATRCVMASNEPDSRNRFAVDDSKQFQDSRNGNPGLAVGTALRLRTKE